MYSKVTFDKEENRDKPSKICTEQQPTGVWYLRHKELIHDDASSNDVFVMDIPEKYHDHEDIIDAKNKEFEKWDTYGAFEEVELCCQHIQGSRWDVVSKDGVPKARFVVKGFHEKDSPRSDSSTASKESLKVFSTIAANENFKLKSLDVTSAFL